MILKGWIIGLIYFIAIFSVCYSQNQKLADSLVNILKSDQHDNSEIDLLRRIAEEQTEPSMRLKFADLLIKKAKTDSLLGYLLSGYLQKGNALLDLGNNANALEEFFKSLNVAQKINDLNGVGALYISIADTYTVIDNPDNARKYYSIGIKILRKVNDSSQLASALLNAGDALVNTKKYNEAETYFTESNLIFTKLMHELGIAYSLGNLGIIYAEQGKHNLAEQNINNAITILEELEDYYPISVYLIYMADIYVEKDNLSKAFIYAKRSLDLALKYGLKDQISDAHLKLSDFYKKSKNFQMAISHYEAHIKFRDSVRNLETIQKMADIRTEKEVAVKQGEVNELNHQKKLLNQQKKNQRIIILASIVTLLLLSVMAVGLRKRNKFIKATNDVIRKEKARSDNLLLNILPEETAKELKNKGSVKPVKFESVSVLFTDFEGFTKYSEGLTPEELVDTVDFYFSKFDEIVHKYGLEKIKTIGDAYMCAGGLPHHSEGHAIKMVKAAFEISKFVEQVAKEHENDKWNFNIRIGINTGPVVAGVVGSKKFAYDIWGDTVNIAARMESHSEPGKVNVSENTYQLIKEEFNCDYRGMIDAKNKGMMKMYFVSS